MNSDNSTADNFFKMITGMMPMEPISDGEIQTHQGGTRHGREIYRELIFHRFYQTIHHVFPLYCREIKKVDPKEPDHTIREFIKRGAVSRYIWQMPTEFAAFAGGLPEGPDFAGDLLWYESSEALLLMGPLHTDKETHEMHELNWDLSWKISQNTRMRALSYKVYEENFENRGNFPVILYYHPNKKEVHFREITPFLVEFLKIQEDGKTSAKAALTRLSKEALKEALQAQDLNQMVDETMSDLREFFQELFELKILHNVS